LNASRFFCSASTCFCMSAIVEPSFANPIEEVYTRTIQR